MTRAVQRFLMRGAGVGLAVFLCLGAVSAQTVAAIPKVGDKAADFALTDAKGATVKLSGELARGPVVLVVGRGWPGYQCPFCTRQFAEFRSHAQELATAGARVLWIYPGPAEALATHAEDFVAGAETPANFRVLIDPGYVFTNAYALRWDAPKETAYPSTFVIDREGVVRFAQVSKEHGGRTPVASVLSVLATLRIAGQNGQANGQGQASIGKDAMAKPAGGPPAGFDFSSLF